MAESDRLLSRTGIAGWALVALLALTAMTNLGGTLADMHLPGRESGQVTTIAAPFTSEDDAQQVLQSWKDWQADQKGDAPPVSAPPGDIVAWWLLVDSILFAPALAIVLLSLARRRGHLLQDSWLTRPFVGGQPLLAVSVMLALGYLFLDEVENALTALFAYNETYVGVRWFSLAKLTLFVAAAVPVALSYIPSVRGGTIAKTPPVLTTVRALRMPLVAVALVVLVMTLLPGSVRPQVHDVVRSWVRGDRFVTGLIALAALVALIAMLWALVSLLRSRCDDEITSGEASRERFVLYIGGGVGLLVLGLAAPDWLSGAKYAAVVLGAGLVGYGLASLPKIMREGTTRSAVRWNANVTRAVVAFPAFAFAMLVLGAIDLVGQRDQIVDGLIFVAAGLALFGAAWTAAGRQLPTAASWTLLGLTTAAATVVAIAAVVGPIGTGRDLGSMALVFVAGILLGAILGSLDYFSGPPRGAFARVGLKRAPVLAILLGVLVLTSFLDQSIEFHATRTVPSTGDAPTATNTPDVSADSLLDSYEAQTTPTDPGVLPLFILSVEGGGGRAAYWTLDTMNCLFGGAAPPTENAAAFPACQSRPAEWQRTFAASGISGGSVGLAMYTAGRESTDGVIDVEEIFDTGFLDPTFATLLFVDAPNSLLRIGSWADRAETLEVAFEDAVPDLEQGFFRTQLEPVEGAGDEWAPRFPILMLNSAGVEDGCRINVSVLRLGGESPLVLTGDDVIEPVDRSCRSLAGPEGPPPEAGEPDTADGVGTGTDVPLTGALAGTRDIADYVCNDDGVDLRLSTAALLSARFVYVSPTGALEACTPLRGRDLHTFAVDGGYVDSSAASPVVELLQRLLAVSSADPSAPCVQPIVLQVDNGYAAESQPTAPGRPQELIAPLAGATAVSGANPARQALANLVTGHNCPVPESVPGDHPIRSVPTYLHIYPQSHPGTEAPLGWSLSQGAQDDLDQQLGRDANQCALLNAKAWLAESTNGLPLCAAVIPTADTCRIVSTPAAAEPAEGPVTCARRRSEAVAPRPSLTYNLCTAPAEGCPTTPAPRCRTPISDQLPCRVTADTRGVVRIITGAREGEAAELDLVLQRAEPLGLVVGLQDSLVSTWLVILLFALALLLPSLVALLTYGVLGNVARRTRMGKRLGV